MIVDVKLENYYNLESFKKILEKYRDYKSFYRELKINSLLGNKSQFDIEEIYPPIIGGFEDSTVFQSTFRLKESAFSINSMSFIVDKDLKVINISLDIKLLETPNGKILKEIIELVEFRVSVVNYKNDFEILGFQACSKNKISA